MTSHEWDNLKDQLRSEYGDRKIGTMVLLDTTMIGHPTSEGIVGRLELLARMPDHLEFAAAVVTTREILLLTAPIPNEEITSKVPFYRSIVAEIRVQK
ncbi:MAG: hypothetical protein JSS75_06545 [Bacteroidetes bacterium]|nr:hypothetical protein [Bacteroidota bacterium]